MGPQRSDATAKLVPLGEICRAGAVLCCLSLAACADTPPKPDPTSIRPDCINQREQVRRLEQEKASIEERIVRGAKTASPAVLMSLRDGDNIKQNADISLGDYNKAVDAKIAEIRRVCGTPRKFCTEVGSMTFCE